MQVQLHHDAVIVGLAERPHRHAIGRRVRFIPRVRLPTALVFFPTVLVLLRPFAEKRSAVNNHYFGGQLFRVSTRKPPKTPPNRFQRNISKIRHEI